MLSCFEGGIFWITVGDDVSTEGNGFILLKRLVALFRKTPTGRLHQWPEDYRSIDDITHRIKRAKGSQQVPGSAR